MPPPSSVRSQAEAKKREEEAKRSLISQYGLSKDIDPRISEAIFPRVNAPVYKITKPGRAQQKRAATEAETKSFFTKSYQEELAKIGQPQITEAIAAGADPRTINKLTESLVSAYVSPEIKRTRGGGQTEAAVKRKLEAAVSEQTQPIKGMLESEAALQPSIQEMRRKRDASLPQQVSLLRRTTGRRALLSSPAGGAGFFSGYFK